MTLLNIETSTSSCSAAITIDGVAVASRANLVNANHASELPVFVDQLLEEAKINAWQLDAVALSQGPGSYTGLRIGTSLAKRICYGINIPLIPVDTLQVLCASIAMHTIPDGALLCPMLDARRMEVYTALYKLESEKIQIIRAVEAKIIDEQSFAEELALQPIYFFGNGAAKCQAFITHPNAHFLDNYRNPIAKNMMPLAERAWFDEKFEDIAYFEPFYLKNYVAAKPKDLLKI